jgi:hypothetical protein
MEWAIFSPFCSKFYFFISTVDGNIFSLNFPFLQQPSAKVHPIPSHLIPCAYLHIS